MPELRVETGPQKSQAFLLRPPGPFRVGRDLTADFPLFDRRASRSHFRIDFRDEGYRITDLGSKAGTSVNDRRIESAVLAGGDHVLAGNTLFSFALDCPDDPLVGRHLGGYRILERVGRGGMGTVYRAVQLSLDRIVAVKVLADELARDPEFSALFVQEARAAAELSHPSIVRVYDVNLLDGILFYAMEFMAQGSAEDLLRRHGPLPIERVLRVAVQASSGLAYAQGHGVVHRDIKPANLMVHEGGAVKIGDLGIALRTQDRGPGRSRGISGSPFYMSPEQALGRDVDSRADVYSLGASVHQLLTGSPPFRGRNLKEILYAQIREDPPDLRALRPGTPEPLVALVKQMLGKDPASRPEPAEAARRLEEVLAEEVRRTARPPRKRRPPRPGLRWGLAAALCLVLGLCLGAFYTHVTGVLSARSARLERVRATIAEGRQTLRAGDLEGARRKAAEIAGFRGSEEEWQILAPEIAAFEREIRGAEAKTKR
ncbi:MAG: protein kinase [Planctomycetes bacterium]|nr:protein kinase [Planctomycetota bacterium]